MSPCLFHALRVCSAQRPIRVSSKTLAILQNLGPVNVHVPLVEGDGGVESPDEDDNKVAKDLGLIPNVGSRLAVTSSVTPEPSSPVAATAGGSGSEPKAGSGSSALAKVPAAVKPKMGRPTERAFDYSVKLLMLGDSGNCDVEFPVVARQPWVFPASARCDPMPQVLESPV